MYNVDSFIQKNRDTFQSSLLVCLLESNISIMKSIFEEELSVMSPENQSLDETRGMRPRFRESINPTKGANNKKGNSSKIRSVGTLVSIWFYIITNTFLV
jgi:myosin heavy subunit